MPFIAIKLVDAQDTILEQFNLVQVPDVGELLVIDVHAGMRPKQFRIVARTWSYVRDESSGYAMFYETCTLQVEAVR